MSIIVIAKMKLERDHVLAAGGGGGSLFDSAAEGQPFFDAFLFGP